MGKGAAAMRRMRKINVTSTELTYFQTSDVLYTKLSLRDLMQDLCCTNNGVPGGLVGYPRAYNNQFREFNSHRVHILVGTFSCIKY